MTSVTEEKDEKIYVVLDRMNNVVLKTKDFNVASAAEDLYNQKYGSGYHTVHRYENNILQFKS